MRNLLSTRATLIYRNAATRGRKISPEELEKTVREKPDIYLCELAAKFDCSISAVHARLAKMKRALRDTCLNCGTIETAVYAYFYDPTF